MKKISSVLPVKVFKPWIGCMGGKNMDYEKAIKNAKWFAVGILVITIIAFCLEVFGSTLSLLSIIIGIAQLVVIIATIKGLNDDQMYGAICGIIVSVLLMLNSDSIISIFGILYLIDCVKLVNYMKNLNMGIASLILGFVSLGMMFLILVGKASFGTIPAICVIVGIILGIMQNKNEKDSKATTGIVLCLIYIIVSSIIAIRNFIIIIDYFRTSF